MPMPICALTCADASKNVCINCLSWTKKNLCCKIERPEMKCTVWEEKDDPVAKLSPFQCMLGEPVKQS